MIWDDDDHDVAEEYEGELQAEETPPRGPVHVALDLRIVDDVRGGKRRFALLRATGPAQPPRYRPPPVAVEGDVLELYTTAGERLFADATIKVTKTQTISMERKGDLAWSQCGRDTASFPFYSTEETALTEMDGWPDDAARFAHYCPEGKRWDGHLIFWEPIP